MYGGGGGGGGGSGAFSKWQFTVFPDERIVIKITGFESCFGGFNPTLIIINPHLAFF